MSAIFNSVDGSHYGLTLLEGPSGVRSAIRGMRMSFNSESASDSTDAAVGGKDIALMTALMAKGDSHSAFARQIVLWYNINMPLHWWKQFDKYRFGVEVRSRSTMHKVMSRPLNTADFTPNVSQLTINDLNAAISDKLFDYVIDNLPGGYLQERVVMMSVAVLRNILKQRNGHRNRNWIIFKNDIHRSLAGYPWLIELLNT